MGSGVPVGIEPSGAPLALPVAFLAFGVAHGLSFGQQQRVLLARALCKNPKILFLDEGTAHVDGPKETQIMKTLCALDLTCVYVTHNPNLLDFATSVVTWEADGSIVQTPTESKQAP